MEKAYTDLRMLTEDIRQTMFAEGYDASPVDGWQNEMDFAIRPSEDETLKVSIVRVIDYQVDDETRERLAEAARPLWDEMSKLGWVDGHGGSEFERVFPLTLDYIHRQANAAPAVA